jgi:tetratricopeptide (TPR) repeat protein
MKESRRVLWVLIILFACIFLDARTPEKFYKLRLTTLEKKLANEYLKLGKKCKRLGIYNKARIEFQHALRLDPQNKQVKKQIHLLDEINVDRNSISIRRYKKLVNQYERYLLKLERKFAKEYAELAKWCKKRGKEKEAKKLIDKALDLDYHCKLARRLIGQVRVKKIGWVDKKDAPELRKGLRKFEGRWLPKKRVDKLRNSWENAWVIKTRHYLIRTNCTLEMGYSLAEEVENVLYKTISRIFSLNRDFKPPKDLMQIYYFNNFSDYKAHVKGLLKGQRIPLAFYSNTTKRCYLYNTPGVKEVFFHEATHQLLFLSFHDDSDEEEKDEENSSNGHVWVVEGLACFSESLAKVGLTLYRLVDTKERVLMGDHVRLRDFIRFNYEKISSSVRYYNQAVCLAHFFMNYKAGRYMMPFLRYAACVHKGEIRKGLFEEIFKTNIDEIEEEWITYMKKIFSF